MSKQGEPSLNMQKNLVKWSYFQKYSTSKLAQVTDHIKESTQLDVYIFRKMARNHSIMNLIRRPYLVLIQTAVSSTHNRLLENFLNYCQPKKDIRFLGGIQILEGTGPGWKKQQCHSLALEDLFNVDYIAV